MNRRGVKADTRRPATTSCIQWSAKHWHERACVRVQNVVAPLRSRLIIFPAAAPRYGSNQAKCHTCNCIHLLHRPASEKPANPRSDNVTEIPWRHNEAPALARARVASSIKRPRSNDAGCLTLPPPASCLGGCAATIVKISRRATRIRGVLVRNVNVCRHPPATY